jgi:hypothetical protein
MNKKKKEWFHKERRQSQGKLRHPSGAILTWKAGVRITWLEKGEHDVLGDLR